MRLDLMKAIRRELGAHGKDITIDNTTPETRSNSLKRFEEFKKLVSRIIELAR